MKPTLLLMLTLLGLLPFGGHCDDDDDKPHKASSATPGAVHLTQAQRQLINLQTQTAKRQQLNLSLKVPASITLDRYQSVQVTPRISAQVLERHARLGDLVEAGQPLVTLSSIEMATAQGVLIEAEAELQRVKKLGRELLSDKRYLNAQISYREAYSSLLAYGLQAQQVEAETQQGRQRTPDGRFQLLAPQAGRIVSDDFSLGELIPPGQKLFEISDTRQLWAEARLSADEAALVPEHAKARLHNGTTTLSAQLIQKGQQLENNSHTQLLRFVLSDPDRNLQPGQRLMLEIQRSEKVSGIAVPLKALLRNTEGEWQLYLQQGEQFKPQEVELLAEIGELALIEGVEEGEKIVTNGAFFVYSELNKGQFVDDDD